VSAPGRREFLARIGSTAIGLGVGPALSFLAASQPETKGKAQRITILQTADIHAQLDVHDEFFFEDGRAAFRRRGGFATLSTMIRTLRQQNPGNTLVVDTGDCFQGSAVAALSKGQAIVPPLNRIGFDLVLPGNWEVVYGKQMLLENLGHYTARKVCTNMFHAGGPDSGLIFPAYQTFTLGSTRVGFVGYNDPRTPTRQSPAYSNGIRFTEPEADLDRYVRILRDEKGCQLVFVLSHLGLAQQIDLSNQPCARGVDYILGGDTHERIREPLQGTFCKVTEPGAFGSFLGKLDLIVENGAIKEETYALLEVDPDRYPADQTMTRLIAKAKEPYRSRTDKVLGTTRTPLLRQYVIETPLDNLITDALMWKFGTDFVSSNGFRFCPPLVPPPGGVANITEDYLWSMLPVDPVLKSGEVTGRQILAWLEKELENVFATDAVNRFGGWLVRFKGPVVTFTIGNPSGSRVRDITIKGQPLLLDKTYTMTGCEREGDPDDVICRIPGVSNPRRVNSSPHKVIAEYLAAHSPVAPVIEGRAVATDAPAELLTQVEHANYRFR
jgi:2',3'-cyclic-nucleotide 2'-phosphodiesterase (5'-nucleotidase family)